MPIPPIPPSAPTILPTRPMSSFGAIGRGTKTGGGTSERAALQAALTWASGNNGVIECDSLEVGGTGIYLFDTPLIVSPAANLRANGCLFRISSSFTQGTTYNGALIINNSLTTNAINTTHGHIAQCFEINLWGGGPSGTTDWNATSQPPITAAGAVFTGTISSAGVLTVGTVISGTVGVGMPLFQKPGFGVPGVIPGEYIQSNISGSGAGSTWQLSNTVYSKPVTAITATGSASTISGYTFTPGGTLSGTFQPGMLVTGSGVTANSVIISGSGPQGTSSPFILSQSTTSFSGAATGTTVMTATNDSYINGIVIQATNNNSNLVLEMLRDVSVTGFSCNVLFSNWSWYLIQLENLQSYAASYCAVGMSSQVSGSTGENVSIFGVSLSNCTNSMGTAMGFYEDGTSQAEITFKKVSVDYCDWNVVVGSGRFYNDDPGHNEGGSNKPLYYISCAASATKTRVKIGDITPASNSTVLSSGPYPGGRPYLIWADNSPVIEIDAQWSTYGQPNTSLLYETVAPVSSLRLLGQSSILANGASLPGPRGNFCSNPTFDNGATIPGWTIDQTSAPAANNLWNLFRNGSWQPLTTGTTGQWPGTTQVLTGAALVTANGITATPTLAAYGAPIPQLVITFSGTATATGNTYLALIGSGNIPASVGDVFFASAYISSTVALANVTGVYMQLIQYSSTGTNLGTIGVGSVATPTLGAPKVLISTAAGGTTLTAAGTAYVGVLLNIGGTASQVMSGNIVLDTPSLGSYAGGYLPLSISSPTIAPTTATSYSSPLPTPFRYGLATSPAPFYGTHTLFIKNDTGTAAAWPVLAGNAITSATWPGIRTSAPVVPGQNVFVAGYVQGSYIGGAGYIVAFRDAQGAPVPNGYGGASSTPGIAQAVGTMASYNVGKIVVASGMSGASDSPVIQGVTFHSTSSASSGTSFQVAGTVAADTPSLLAQLIAAGSTAVNYWVESNYLTTGIIYYSAAVYGNGTVISGTSSSKITITTNAGAYAGGITGTLVSANQPSSSGMCALGAITFINQLVAGDQFLLGPTPGSLTIFTAVASGASNPQFNIGATQALTMANLVAAINANATVSAVLTASARTVGNSSNIIDLTYNTTGTAGNGYIIEYTQGGANPSAKVAGPLGDGVYIGSNTTAGSMIYGNPALQCSSSFLAPNGAAYIDVYPSVNASFQGTAYFNNVNIVPVS